MISIQMVYENHVGTKWLTTRRITQLYSSEKEAHCFIALLQLSSYTLYMSYNNL